MERGESLATTESSFVSAEGVDDIGNNISNAKANLIRITRPLGVKRDFCKNSSDCSALGAREKHKSTTLQERVASTKNTEALE